MIKQFSKKEKIKKQPRKTEQAVYFPHTQGSWQTTPHAPLLSTADTGGRALYIFSGSHGPALRGE